PETSAETAADVRCRHIVSTHFHALAHAGDGNGRIGQPKIVEINLKALLLCPAQKSDVGRAAQCAFESECFALANKGAEFGEEKSPGFNRRRACSGVTILARSNPHSGS